MKVIIAGSRELDDETLVDAAVLASGFDVSLVIEGEGRGIDRAARRWAKKRSIPVDPYPADWDAFGKAAGPIRNGAMAEVGDALIAIPHPSLPSHGTRDMIEQAELHGLLIYIHKL